jgi:hypothetical protein
MYLGSHCIRAADRLCDGNALVRRKNLWDLQIRSGGLGRLRISQVALQLPAMNAITIQMLRERSQLIFF